MLGEVAVDGGLEVDQEMALTSNPPILANLSFPSDAAIARKKQLPTFHYAT
jgi:hypothetical protein